MPVCFTMATASAFLNRQGAFEGFRVNRVDGDWVYPLEKRDVKPGALLYRNYDHSFEQQLQKKSAERCIPVDMRLYEIPRGLALKITDDTGLSAVVACRVEKEVARTPQDESQVRQLSRLGDSHYEARRVDVAATRDCFVPVSLLADLRRKAIEALTRVRRMAYRRPRRRSEGAAPFPAASLSYLGNVSNHLARTFYRDHGVENIEPAYECRPVDDAALMFTRFCIKKQWGKCPRERAVSPDKNTWKEPLYLQYRDTLLRVEFDCRQCQMRLYRASLSRGEHR